MPEFGEVRSPYVTTLDSWKFFLAGNDIKNADFIIDIYSKVKFDFKYKNLKINIEGLPLRSRQ